MVREARRARLRGVFVDLARERLEGELDKLGMTWVGEVEETHSEAACAFVSASDRSVVSLGSGHLATVDAIWERLGKRRWLRGRRSTALGLDVLAEVMDVERLRSLPVRSVDDLAPASNRLAGWLRGHGRNLRATDEALWRRAERVAKERAARWLRGLRDPQQAARVDRMRQEAHTASQRGDLEAMVEAYEAIESWLTPSELEELAGQQPAVTQASRMMSETWTT